MTFTAGGETHLLHTVDITGSPHTGQFLAELAITEIARAEEMFGTRVVAVVTDNTSNMVAFREELQRAKKLCCFGCQSHLFNLLVQGLSKEKPGLLEKIVHALKWFLVKQPPFSLRSVQEGVKYVQCRHGQLIFTSPSESWSLLKLAGRPHWLRRVPC